ncbi:hypothetical protein [Paenibacillus sp. sgz302251]|uniref:hypothetical protein n=1 Tax=Paenibacillus sp. sgz302251 TaxID=3414493 RepID=UPI003C79A146
MINPIILPALKRRKNMTALTAYGIGMALAASMGISGYPPEKPRQPSNQGHPAQMPQQNVNIDISPIADALKS